VVRLSTNAYWNGSSYIATGSTSTLLSSSELSGLSWYYKTGNTTGSPFSLLGTDERLKLQIDGNMGLGTAGSNTLPTKLTIVSNDGQINTRTDNTTSVGGFFGSTNNTSQNTFMSAGANNINGAWTAKDATSVIFRASTVDGSFNISVDKLLTIGNIFTPTQRFKLTGNGTGISDGATDIIVNSSAILDLQTTVKGFLPPRMTTSQRTSISSPAEGLCVYDLTLHKLYVWDSTSWQAAW
ncbi:MAG: hypothetical protein ABI091_02190, partial [Ferruginibacter sp.]